MYEPFEGAAGHATVAPRQCGCSPPSSARHHARLAAQASTHTRTHTLTHATRTHRTYRRLTPHTPHTARGCLSVYESCTKHRAKTGVEVERVVYIIVPTERITAVLVKSFKSEKVHSPKRKKEVFSLRWAPREIRHGTSTTTTTTTTTLNINNNSHMRMCFSVAWFQGVRNQGYSSVVISSVQPPRKILQQDSRHISVALGSVHTTSPRTDVQSHDLRPGSQ